MSETSIRLNTFAGGVSTKPPPKRLMSEVEEAINVNLTLERNIDRRCGSEYLNTLGLDTSADWKFHFIDRGEDTEEYVIALNCDTGDMYSVRANSSAAPIQITTGTPWTDYLTAGTSENIKFLTVLDSTFILNTSVEACYLNTGDGALLTYNEATNTSPVREQTLDDPNSQFVSNYLQFRLPPQSGDPDAANGASSIIGLGRVYLANQGYLNFPDGFYKAISSTQQPYYTPVRTEGAGSVLDKDTLPVILKNTGTDTFELDYPDWKPRYSGDLLTNPGPSPIAATPAPFDTDTAVRTGAKISAMAFFKNRLWFASGTTIFSSADNDLFNFFRRDGNSVEATDPIDLVATAGNVVSIASFSVFEDFMFAQTKGNTQFEISTSGASAATPTTTTIKATTFYGASPEVEPFRVGSQLLWLDKGDMYIYLPESQNSTTIRAVNVSKHAEGYLPTSLITATAVDENRDTIFWTAENDNSIYIYKQKWSAESQSQSSFYKWTNDHFRNINKMWVLDDFLYILGVEGDDTDQCFSVLRTNLGLSKLPKNQSVRAGVDNVDEWPLIEGHFVATLPGVAGDTNATLISRDDDNGTKFRIIGYHPNIDVCLLSDERILSEDTDTSLYTPGEYNTRAEVVDVTPVYNSGAGTWTTEITVKGYRYNELIVGTSYESRVELSPFVLKDERQQFSGSINQIKSVLTRTYDSGPYSVEVTNRLYPDRDAKEVYISQVRDSDAFLTTGLPIGVYDETAVPVALDGDAARVSYISDSYLPLNITNTELRITARTGSTSAR